MLALVKANNASPIDCSDYYIQEEWYGAEDQLVLAMDEDDPQLLDLMLQDAIIDKESGQTYRVTDIDQGDVKATLDLSELQATLLVPYTNNSDTVAGTITQVLPEGWTVQDLSGVTIRRTIEGEGMTPLDVITACPDVYNVAIRFDNKGRRVLVYYPDDMEPTGSYASSKLNLRRRPIRQGKTADYATRLYAYGKDGLSFADINDGKAYVEDHSTDARIVCKIWMDERYTVKENLLEDAKRKVKEMASLGISYELDMVDLAKIDPEKWGHLTAEMYRPVLLLDEERNVRALHKVVRYRRYPEHPEKNQITLSTIPGTLSSKTDLVYQAVNNPNSGFQQQWKGYIGYLVDGIAGYDGGNMIITKNKAGKPNGIMIMDTEDQTTAQKILWLNLKGILYSSTGLSGFDADPEKTTVWSFDKNGLSVNWAVFGRLDCSLIEVVNLVAQNVKLSGNFRSISGNFFVEMWAGVFKMGQNNGQKDNEFISMYTSASDPNNGSGALAVREVLGGDGQVKTLIVGGSITTEELSAQTLGLSGAATIGGKATVGKGLQVTGGVSADTMDMGGGANFVNLGGNRPMWIRSDTYGVQVGKYGTDLNGCIWAYITDKDGNRHEVLKRN